MKLELISHTQNAEEVIAVAGKLCYSPVDIESVRNNLTEEVKEKFITMLMEIGHGSPLEHASFTFGVEGISRACSHQLVRHRMASYSQQSQRYVNMDEFEYVKPKILKAMNSDAQQEFDEDMKIIGAMYKKWHGKFLDHLDQDTEFDKFGMPNSKVANENARAVLPNACTTKLIFTMNLRTIINFVKHRACNRAQDEINEVAKSMVVEIEKIYPLLGQLLGAPCQTGKCTEGKMNCGKPYPKKR